jgi:hypothetical protein
MPSFDVNVDFEVVCAECGSDLDCKETRTRSGRRSLRVSPCKPCLEAAAEEALAKARKDS